LAQKETKAQQILKQIENESAIHTSAKSPRHTKPDCQLSLSSQKSK